MSSRRSLSILANSIATSTVVTLLASLILLALPLQYQASATIPGGPDDLPLLGSAQFLESVVTRTRLDLSGLSTATWVQRDEVAGTPMNVQHLVAVIRENITLQTLDDGRWINLSMSARDPELAANLVNEIALAHMTNQAQSGGLVGDGTMVARIEAAEQALEAYLDANPRVADVSGRATRLDTQENSIHGRILDLEKEIAQLGFEIDQLERGDIASIQQDRVVQIALQNRDNVRSKREQLATRYGSRHRKIITVSAELAAAEDRLREQVEVSVDRKQQRREMLDTERDELHQQLSVVEGELQRLAEEESAVRDLQLKVDEAKRDLEVATESRAAEFATAVVPTEPDTARYNYVLIGVFLATLIITSLLLNRIR